MSKRFLIIMAVLVALFIGTIVVSKNRQTANAPGSSDTKNGTNYTQGNGSKGITLVEFGDFQCPACGSYYPIIKAVQKKYNDELTFQFRNFPLVQIHKNAMVAHRAAEAAGRQGKFWEMHDLLYERQNSWVESNNPSIIMEDYATELGLNIDKYKTDFSSPATNDVISADMAAGQALGVDSTPTFILDGTKIKELPKDVAAFSKLIDEAIANK